MKSLRIDIGEPASHGSFRAECSIVLAKVLVWLQESASGDRSEINLNGPAERDVWARLSAEDDGCKTEVCVKRTGGACGW